MGAGIYGGFGHTKGYNDAIAGDVVFASGEKLYFQYISKRKDIDSNGKYDVVAHGSDKSIMVRHGNKDIEINARVASKLIKNRKDYKEGKPIRLLSCNTGNLDNGFAQNLANKLGVTVYAPTDIIWARPNGTHYIAPYKKGTKLPNNNFRGRFRKFIPGGNKYGKKRKK